MSLVNDMLRDLDAGKREPLPEGVAVRDGHGPARAHSGTQRKYVTVGLAVVLIAVAFYSGVNWQSASAPEPTIAMSQASLSMETETVSLQGQAATAPVSQARPELAPNHSQAAPFAHEHDSAPAEKISAPSAASEGQEQDGTDTVLTARIEGLLREAERALAENRLTTPIEDNAFSRYQAILLLAPTQPQALEGIREIAQRYLRFYTETVSSGSKSAAHYRDKAARVVAGYPQLASWFDQRLEQAKVKMAQVAEPTTVEPPTVASESTAVDSPVEPEVATVSTPVRVVKTDRDQRVAAQAGSLMAQGRFAPAKSLLLAHLQQYPDSPAARRALVELYLQTANAAAAQVHLEQLAEIADYERAHLDARIAMLKGDLELALGALDSVRPVVADAPDYYAYRAALFHQAERYRQAAEVYEQLLTLRRDDSTYWLGLAVSLDALKDRAGALRAFRNAYRYSPADAPSRAYVEERIRSLSS